MNCLVASFISNEIFFFGVMSSEEGSGTMVGAASGVSMTGDFSGVLTISSRSPHDDRGDLWMNPDHVRTLRTSSSVCCLATGDVGMGDKSVSSAVFLEKREDGGKLWEPWGFLERNSLEFLSDCLFLRFSNDEARASLALASAGSSRAGAGSCVVCEGVRLPVPVWVWLSWRCWKYCLIRLTRTMICVYSWSACSECCVCVYVCVCVCAGMCVRVCGYVCVCVWGGGVWCRCVSKVYIYL